MKPKENLKIILNTIKVPEDSKKCYEFCKSFMRNQKVILNSEINFKTTQKVILNFERNFKITSRGLKK